jgi:hypothetical protein
MRVKGNRMKTIKTEWYPATTKPVREGWYERDYTVVFGVDKIFLDLWLPFSQRDGYWYVNEPAGELNDAYYEELPWRGVKRKGSI